MALLLGHAADADGERDGDDRRQALGDGGHGQGDLDRMASANDWPRARSTAEDQDARR